MSEIKERIIGAVTIMTDQDAEKIWQVILDTFKQKEWVSIPEEHPDEIDLAMLADIQSNPDCHTFVTSEDAMKELGLSECVVKPLA
mgnify:CR=1 FL=1